MSATNGRLACLSGRDGRRLWLFTAPSARPPLLETIPYIRGRGNVLTRAVPLPDGRLVVGGACGRLWVLALSTGEVEREINVGSAVLATPLVHDDGGGCAVTVADFDGGVHHYCAGAL